MTGLLAICAFSANWTDRKEYDLVLTIRSEAMPQKRLDLLELWNKNYPKTELREARLELYLATYEALGDRNHMFETSRQILADQPGNLVGLYWSTVLLPQLESPSAEMMGMGEKSARQLISGLDTYFNGERKLASTTDADWQKQKSSVEILAHRALGWAHWQRGEFQPAEEEFTACLQKDPLNTEISAWLGIVLALENGKQIPALWHLARASKAVQSGALSEDQHRQVNTILERIYTSYHGVSDGLDELKTAAAASPFPPPEFSIDSATVVAARKAEADLSLTNPELAAWLAIRRQLEALNGDNYFTANLESKPLPRLKGTVVRCTPAHSPREIVLSMTDSRGQDIILKLSSSLTRYVGPGSKIAFQGTAQSFSKEPFSLVVLADPAGIEGASAKK